MHDWMVQRTMLSALGVREDGMPEAVFSRAAADFDAQHTTRRAADPAQRAEQIAAFVAASGDA